MWFSGGIHGASTNARATRGDMINQYRNWVSRSLAVTVLVNSWIWLERRFNKLTESKVYRWGCAISSLLAQKCRLHVGFKRILTHVGMTRSIQYPHFSFWIESGSQGFSCLWKRELACISWHCVVGKKIQECFAHYRLSHRSTVKGPLFHIY